MENLVLPGPRGVIVLRSEQKSHSVRRYSKFSEYTESRSHPIELLAHYSNTALLFYLQLWILVSEPVTL
jgi:hypothetical protein